MNRTDYPMLTYLDNGGWERDFPREAMPLSSRLRRLFGAVLARPSMVGGERQAEFFDTSFYFRLNGLDPEKVARNADMLIIQAGIGNRMAVTLPEHIAIAKDEGKRYATYLIPDVDSPLDLDEQVENWFGWPGVADAPMVSDVEKPRAMTRHINSIEFRDFQMTMKSLSPFQTWSYSRVSIFETIFAAGFPAWMDDVNQWIAQYYLDTLWNMYRYFDDWLPLYAWQYPRAVIKSPLYADSFWRERVKAHQISPKFDGNFYLSPEWISPGQPGIKSVDGNVSIEPLSVFLDYFPESGGTIPPPPPEPVTGDRFETLFAGQNFRTEPSNAKGAGTVIRKLPAGEVIKATPCETAGQPYTGVSTYIPGMSHPKDVWVHGKDESGVSGWLAAYHPSRSSVFIESLEAADDQSLDGI